MTIKQEVKRYIKENKKFFKAVILRAAEHVKNGVDMASAIKKGMAEEIAFEQEISDGLTERAQLARKALAFTVHQEIGRRDFMASLVW